MGNKIYSSARYLKPLLFLGIIKYRGIYEILGLGQKDRSTQKKKQRKSSVPKIFSLRSIKWNVRGM